MALPWSEEGNQRQQILAHDRQTQSKLSVRLLQSWLRPGKPR